MNCNFLSYQHAIVSFLLELVSSCCFVGKKYLRCLNIKLRSKLNLFEEKCETVLVLYTCLHKRTHLNL